MGQTNSKASTEHIHHRASSPASSPSAPAALNPPISEQSPIPTSSSSQTNTSLSPDVPLRRSRQSSVHQTILNLVKRRTTPADNDVPHSIPNRTDLPIPTSSSHSSRKRWRSSRRWSKAPAVPDSASPEVDPSTDIATPPSDLSKDKGKGKENEPVVHSASSHTDSAVVLPESSTSTANTERPSTPYPHSYMHQPLNAENSSSSWSSSPSPGTSSSHADHVHSGSGARADNPTQQKATSDGRVSLDSVIGAEISNSTSAVSRNDEDVLGSSSNDQSTSPTPRPSTTLPSTESNMGSLPIRQFPPPGTLVVVQGVVHTTDVPPTPSPQYETTPSHTTPSLHPSGLRRRASSTPRPSTPALAERSGTASNTRHRLSALIPRSRVPSTQTSSSDIGSLTANAGNSSASISNVDGTDDTARHSSSSQTPRNTDSRENGARGHGAISSSSIDVLGTLLSVAAAATAASLLTGSSEPIFSSGLPQRSNDNASSPTPNFLRPTSGFAGLPFGFANPDSDNGHGSESAAQRGRDRVRQAWGSLRERLGLRGTNQNTSSSNDNTPLRTRPDGTPMDARELMLAEMARAFNLGLGLGNEGTGDLNFARNALESGNRERDVADMNSGLGRPTPPEDSFERFLMDLQSELRVVLSQPANGGSDSAPHPSTGQSSSESEDVLTTSSTHEPLTSTLASVATEIGEEQMPSVENTSDDVGRRNSEDETEEDPTTPTTDMPPLVPVNPTVPFPPSPRLVPDPAVPDVASAESSPQATTTSTTNRTETRRDGAINWWRLYRFPPITSPHQGMPGPFTPMGLTVQPSTSPDFAPQPNATSTSSTSPTETTTSTAAGSRPNTVIPVIVVGLQSVNTGNRGRRDPGSGDSDDVGGQETDTNGSIEDDLDFDGFPGDSGVATGETQQRERRWHSRAAHAIRNLRPGRRATVERNSPNESLGSRTFLIYVIGGYYPPDHHIVTSANTLDSFEALWELAELLGQVKPPTVTREEIERSGLEVVAPAVLAEYEKEGKVASNCTERCLICLDDYVPEDDVRLLNCRHAFHKNCVDKWLQTGRNSCPACRSKGVTTEDVPSMYSSSA